MTNVSFWIGVDLSLNTNESYKTKKKIIHITEEAFFGLIFDLITFVINIFVSASSTTCYIFHGCYIIISHLLIIIIIIISVVMNTCFFQRKSIMAAITGNLNAIIGILKISYIELQRFYQKIRLY